MSDQQQILPCVVCGQHHEQMLMLSCLHDPCINCAAIRFVENAPKNSLSYSCSKCSEQTQLDESSVIQLQRIYRSLKPVQQENKKYQYNKNITKPNRESGSNSKSRLTEHSDHYDQYNYKNIQNPVSNKYESNYKADRLTGYNQSSHSALNHTPTNLSAKKTFQGISTVMCHEHPEDQLTYFCFTCNKPICPECAIHGSHREHQVQTTRKAIKQIKDRLGESNEKLSSEIGHLMHKKQDGRKHLKELSDTQKKDHDQIKRQFNRLKNQLVEKEKQFLNAISQTYEKNCEQIKFFGGHMDKLIEGYNNVRRNIDITLKRDDISVMQQFNKRQDQANEILDKNSSLNQQSQIRLTKKIDYEVFQNELNQLSGILESMRLTLTANRNQY